MPRHHSGNRWLLFAAPLAILCCTNRAPADQLELVQTIVLKGKAGSLDHLALDSKRGACCWPTRSTTRSTSSI